jgi:glycosyltransferase involved in cell wall biosynthesis
MSDDQEHETTRNMPLISIVTPSFNQAAYIGEALESVEQQGYPDVEHLVFDGASKDKTCSLLEDYGERKEWSHLRWTSEPDNGQSDALNKGFRVARGDIVGWLNSDDRYRPGAFNAIVRAFAESPDVDVFYGDYQIVDGNGQFLQLRREIEYSFFVLAYHRVLYIPTPSAFFRRRVFDEGNFLDPSFQYAMDYEFFFRLALRGYRFQHIRKVLADFRIHEESKTGNAAFKQIEEHNLVAQRYAPLLSRLPAGPLFRTVLGGARVLAAARRYSEKALRGYYFSQYRRESVR